MDKKFMTTEIRFKVASETKDMVKRIAEGNGETISGFARRAMMEKLQEKELRKEAA
jgi:uncharacterized protein (DUF1778 family)